MMAMRLMMLSMMAGCVQGSRLKLSSGSNISLQSEARCRSWCESDRAKQEHRHCGSGDMARMCGDCKYCTSGKCEWWCESDRTKQEHRHCAPGDMADKCGGCSYCGGDGKDPVDQDPVDPVKPGSAVTIVSYNLMSWCTQGNCRGGRMKTVANGIKKYKPAILGTQEHGDGNAPYDVVRASLTPTGLTHRGGGTYYDASVVEPVGKFEEVAIYKSYRFVSGQVYKKKGCAGSSCEFAFFNTHWDHGHHDSQANKVIEFMKRKSGGRAMVLTGDFNVWGSKRSIEHIKRSLALIEASDPHAQTWCTGGKVDFILASRNGFAASGAVTDANHCSTSCDGCSWKGSDHKLLKADLSLEPRPLRKA